MHVRPTSYSWRLELRLTPVSSNGPSSVLAPSSDALVPSSVLAPSSKARSP